MKKDLAMKAIGYAVLFNAIVAFVPLVFELTAILQAPRLNSSAFVNSTLTQTAETMMCYVSFLGCQSKLTYVAFIAMWLVFNGIMYLLSSHITQDTLEKKRLLVWFAVAFPFANYFVVSVFGVMIFILETLQFGFV